VPYKPLLDKALELANHNVQHSIIVQRKNVQKCDLGPEDLPYEEVMEQVSAPANAVPLSANQPHCILHISGTTRPPKGVVQGYAGWAVALKYSMVSLFHVLCFGVAFLPPSLLLL
jgi:propionyl-CoA synthetase